MNTVYKNINMKVKLWEEKIILLPDWERRKKKNLRLLQEKKKKFEISLHSRTTPERLRILFFAAVTIPFIGLVKESLIPTRTHSVQMNLTRGRSLELR